MLTPAMITAAVVPLLQDQELNIANLMATMKSKEEHEDPAEVKVVVDKNNYSLYFSREPIPSRKKGVDNVPMLKQVCIIPFRRNFLLEYN
uniref:cytidylyltransferase domain-containing protein n=1 Tax=Stenotrophomonas maltophilia TaxID=40324 RepID=UPI0019550056